MARGNKIKESLPPKSVSYIASNLDTKMSDCAKMPLLFFLSVNIKKLCKLLSCSSEIILGSKGAICMVIF